MLTGHYDLVLTDVDMPRLDGFELIKLIRKDQRLKALPVMIVRTRIGPKIVVEVWRRVPTTT